MPDSHRGFCLIKKEENATVVEVSWAGAVYVCDLIQIIQCL